MFDVDVARADQRLLDAAALVVDEILAVTSLDPASILLVGATCRDVLHSALGHEFDARATDDIDIGIALDDWRAITQIHETFKTVATKRNGIRYRIAGAFNVDVMPFGGVEDPSGLSQPPARGEDLIVFGFADVLTHAMPLPLRGGRTIRIPRPAGYAALKLRSWIDRSRVGEYKDAEDLALVAYWYQESQEIRDELWDPERELDRLAGEFGLDDRRGAVALLRRDLMAQLSPAAQEELADLMAPLEAQDFADRLELPPLAPTRFAARERRTYAEILSSLREDVRSR